MVIDEDILIKNDAEILTYSAGETIFLEGAIPKFYFQIRSGLIKLSTYRDDGSEFIYSVPSDGHCFAETFLWYEVPYCLNAIVISDTEILRMKKTDFMSMISSDIELMKNIMAYTSERMFYRYKMLNTLSLSNSVRRIYDVLTFLKTHHKVIEPFAFSVPFTRLQLASLTGLRLETVIRTVKKLESDNLLKIINGKIHV